MHRFRQRDLLTFLLCALQCGRNPPIHYSMSYRLMAFYTDILKNEAWFHFQHKVKITGEAGGKFCRHFVKSQG